MSGLIEPNELRPMVRGEVASRRIGAFTHRALSQPRGRAALQGHCGARPVTSFHNACTIIVHDHGAYCHEHSVPVYKDGIDWMVVPG